MRDSYMFYVDRLEGEYKENFEQIMTYVTAQNNDEDSVETQMGELLDVFLQAQEIFPYIDFIFRSIQK